MSEQPTPETDAFITSQDYSPTGHQWRNFTRKLERERDEAREVVSRIEEIFCDGEDTHDDWMKMGNIARDYLKGLE